MSYNLNWSKSNRGGLASWEWFVVPTNAYVQGDKFFAGVDIQSDGQETPRVPTQAERDALAPEARWAAYLNDVPAQGERPLYAGAPLETAPNSGAFQTWVDTNVYRQRQPGYVVATITLPLGDLSGWQLRRLADLARHFGGDAIRTTVEQNIVLRWGREADLPELHRQQLAPVLVH